MKFGFDIDDTLIQLREHAFHIYNQHRVWGGVEQRSEVGFGPVGNSCLLSLAFSLFCSLGSDLQTRWLKL